MKCRYVLLLSILLMPLVAFGQLFKDPFKVSASIDSVSGENLLSVSFEIPDAHYLYADKVNISAGDVTLKPKKIPKSKQYYDDVLKETHDVYKGNVVFLYEVPSGVRGGLELVVSYIGCNASICLRPQSRNFALELADVTGGDGSPEPGVADTSEVDDLKKSLGRFPVLRKGVGYMEPQDFIEFLKGTDEAGDRADSSMDGTNTQRNIWVSVLLILIWGLALNLTPCVLPMIPVNIAIIGAGASSSSKGRGFALGATYGAGMAIVYGVLGLAVILTGARFGAMNSSPWFNAAIALFFVVLSLSMFGVFNVDFSRFQSNVGVNKGSKGKFVTAFFLGAVAALLAGACVAPVVIFTLLLAANLYAKGHVLALSLPFLLGLGMALPWPFAGAGLSFLPKPGMWMERIKYGFGVVILAAAAYYGVLSYRIFSNTGQDQSFSEMVTAAASQGKPVFVDFWASWCKNCKMMDKTTFKDKKVLKELEGFTFVKYQAESLNDPEVKAVLDYYEVVGLPTYLVLGDESMK